MCMTSLQKWLFCLFTSGELAAGAIPGNYLQTSAFSQAGRIQGVCLFKEEIEINNKKKPSLNSALPFFLFFQESDVYCIPTSGLSGENLATRSSTAELTSWYSGPSLLEQIGNATVPHNSAAKKSNGPGIQTNSFKLFARATVTWNASHSKFFHCRCFSEDLLVD